MSFKCIIPMVYSIIETNIKPVKSSFVLHQSIKSFPLARYKRLSFRYWQSPDIYFHINQFWTMIYINDFWTISLFHEDLKFYKFRTVTSFWWIHGIYLYMMTFGPLPVFVDFWHWPVFDEFLALTCILWILNVYHITFLVSLHKRITSSLHPVTQELWIVGIFMYFLYYAVK